MKGNLKRLEFTGELFPALFYEGSQWRVDKGIPVTSEFVRLDFDPIRNIYTIIIFHTTFDLIGPGDEIPLLDRIEFRHLGEARKL